MKHLTILIALICSTFVNAQELKNFTFSPGTINEFFGANYPNGILKVNNLTVIKGARVSLTDMIIEVEGDLITTGVAHITMKNSKIIIRGKNQFENQHIYGVSKDSVKIKRFKELNKKDTEILVIAANNKVMAKGDYKDIKDIYLPVGFYDLRIKSKKYITKAILR